MDSSKQIKFDITAENQGFVAAMEKTAAAALAGSDAIQAQFGKVGEVFSTVTKTLAGLAALLAGGAAFAKGIDATKELTGEAVKLSKTLGISTQDASVLNVALRSIGSSTDVYTDANAKLTRQIRTNEAAVNEMGVKTRGANGQLLDGKQIMQNALATLASYKEGTDRNLAGQQLFGKGAAEVTALLKLNNAVMEEAAKKAAALGLVIGPEQAANTKAYKEAMEGVQLVLTAVQNAIGQAVMPVLTRLAGWFNDTGPAAVSLMRDATLTFVDAVTEVGGIISSFGRIAMDIFAALGDLVSAVVGEKIPAAFSIVTETLKVSKVLFLEFKAVIVTVSEEIGVVFTVLASDAQRLAEVIRAALSGSWAGVTAAWEAGAKRGERIVAESAARVKKLMIDTQAEIDQTMNPYREHLRDGANPPRGKPTGDRLYRAPTSGDSDRLKAEFAVIKAKLEGELAIQKEYLAEAQQAYDDAYRHNQLTVEQFYAAKLTIERAGLKGAIDIKAEEVRQVKELEDRAAKPADQLALQAQRIKLTAELTVLTAQLAHTEIKNARELNNELEIRRNRMLEIQRVSMQQAGTSQVNMDRIALEQRRQLRQISDAQALQAERALQERLYQVDRQAAEAKLQRENLSVADKAEINREIEQLERKHAEEMAKIDKDIVVETAGDTLAAQSQIEGATETFLASLGDRTQSIADKFKSLAQSIERAFMELAAKQIGKQLFGSLTGSVGGGGNNAGWLGGLMNTAMGALRSYDVGTPFVPQDMIAKIHKGERIVTAKDNASGNFGGGAGSPININITVPGNVDRRTAQQIAAATGQAVQRALARGT